jgi:hypothetical protein
VWSPWSRFLEQRKLRELDSGDGVLSGVEGEVEEHEGHESYLWMGSVEAGVAGGGPAAVGLGHGGDVPACWGLKRLGEMVQELPRDDVVLLE